MRETLVYLITSITSYFADFMLHQSRLVDLEGKDRYLVSVLRGIINQFLLPNVLLQRKRWFLLFNNFSVAPAC